MTKEDIIKIVTTYIIIPNQTTTKTEDKTIATQISVGMTDSPAAEAGPSASFADRSTLESGPSTPRLNASDDVPTPMEEDNTEEDDLLGEYLVDYGASPKHPGMDVNVIMFLAYCTTINYDEPVVAKFDFGPKEVAFTKPKESVNHLKSLFVCGHIDEISIAKIFVDGRATMNLMPYSLYKKNREVV
jgi:hypothetical protein